MALSNLHGQGNEWECLPLPGETCLPEYCKIFKIIGNSCKKQTAVVQFQYEVHLEFIGITEEQEALDFSLPSWHLAPACLQTRIEKLQASSASCLSPPSEKWGEVVLSSKLFIGWVFVYQPNKRGTSERGQVLAYGKRDRKWWDYSKRTLLQINRQATFAFSAHCRLFLQSCRLKAASFSLVSWICYLISNKAKNPSSSLHTEKHCWWLPDGKCGLALFHDRKDSLVHELS